VSTSVKNKSRLCADTVVLQHERKKVQRKKHKAKESPTLQEELEQANNSKYKVKKTTRFGLNKPFYHIYAIFYSYFMSKLRV